VDFGILDSVFTVLTIGFEADGALTGLTSAVVTAFSNFAGRADFTGVLGVLANILVTAPTTFAPATFFMDDLIVALVLVAADFAIQNPQFDSTAAKLTNPACFGNTRQNRQF
jgi:hypothetical protein